MVMISAAALYPEVPRIKDSSFLSDIFQASAAVQLYPRTLRSFFVSLTQRFFLLNNKF